MLTHKKCFKPLVLFSGYGSSNQAQRAGVPECDREGWADEDVVNHGSAYFTYTTSRSNRLRNAYYVRCTVVKVIRKQGMLCHYIAIKIGRMQLHLLNVNEWRQSF